MRSEIATNVPRIARSIAPAMFLARLYLDKDTAVARIHVILKCPDQLAQAAVAATR